MSYWHDHLFVIGCVYLTFVLCLLLFHFGFHLFLDFRQGRHSMKQKIESKVESHWQCVSERLSQIYDSDPIRKLNSVRQSHLDSRVLRLSLHFPFFYSLHISSASLAWLRHFSLRFLFSVD